MTRNDFSQQARANEALYFNRVDGRLWQKLREEVARAEQHQSLVDATGLADDAVVQKLIDLGLRSETIRAFHLLPLVQAAWASNAVAPSERAAVLEAAQSAGCPRGSSAYGLLENWLDRRPEREFAEAWRSYAAALWRTMKPEAREIFRQDLLAQARAVAEAAGGVLGVCRVSRAEQHVLTELQAILAGEAADNGQVTDYCLGG